MTACEREIPRAASGGTAPNCSDRRCHMGTLDKVTQRLQGLLGKAKSKADDARSDEVKAAVKEAGGAVKNAAVQIKDALKGG